AESDQLVEQSLVRRASARVHRHAGVAPPAPCVDVRRDTGPADAVIRRMPGLGAAQRRQVSLVVARARGVLVALDAVQAQRAAGGDAPRPVLEHEGALRAVTAAKGPAALGGGVAAGGRGAPVHGAVACSPTIAAPSGVAVSVAVREPALTSARVGLRGLAATCQDEREPDGEWQCEADDVERTHVATSGWVLPAVIDSGIVSRVSMSRVGRARA